MESSGREYLGMVCKLYACAVLAVLPLYMKEGYWQIGDVKYELYRNVTLLCLAAGMLAGLICLAGRARAGHSGEVSAVRHGISFSVVDFFILSFALANVISYLESRYPDTAWYGYEQWHMGLLSQLLFTGSYFLISRGYDGSLLPVRCGQAALIAVSLLGVLNRLRVDPLGLFVGLTSMDWDYNHLLSTVGNINWLSSYLCVVIPLALADYLQTKKKSATYFTYAASLSGLLLLCIQGSDTGLLAFAAALLFLFVLGLKGKEQLRRVLSLFVGIAAAFTLLGVGIRVRDSWYTFPYDDKSRYLVCWWGWIPVLIALAILIRLTYKYDMPRFGRICKRCLWIGGGVALAGALLFLLVSWKIDYSWGNGRGGLWAMAVRAFREGSPGQKLWGVGPDCYGEYVYEFLPVREYLVQTGHFANSVFINAHNEWLNQLVNTGILGTACYIGIFVSSSVRYGKRVGKDNYFYLGLMTLGLYILHSIASFQQVMNAPILFLVIGMCESRCRKETH